MGEVEIPEQGWFLHLETKQEQRGWFSPPTAMSVETNINFAIYHDGKPVLQLEKCRSMTFQLQELMDLQEALNQLEEQRKHGTSR